MEYRVLGSLEVLTAGGAPVPVAADRQTALVCALLARRGEVVSTDTLVDLLWGDNSPANPANAVQVLVSRLRTAVRNAGDELTDLRTASSGYVLDTRGSRVDAEVFEEAVAGSSGTEPGTQVTLLRRALGLWRGRAFAEHADDEIAHLEAIRLEEIRRTATVRLGEALVAAGSPDEAVAVLDPFVVANPLHEGARAGLMRGLYATGRHPDALAVYTDYRTVLGEELGLEPSAALQALELAILRHEVDEPAPAPATATARGPGRLAAMKVRYAAAATTPVAYATLGTGPRLVVVPAWVTSLDVMASGRDPRSTLLERLAGHTALTMYDRAGTGLTGGGVEDFSLDAAVRELTGVLEATGGPGAVLAMSQSGPVALRVAASRPDLVRRLVLFGTYASGPGVFANPQLFEALVAMSRTHWGIGSRALAGLYRPGSSDAAADHLAKVLRDSAPADVSAGYLEAAYTADAGDVLGEVACPTLVIHYRNDRVIPFEGARQLVAGLRDVQLIALDGPYHLPDVGDLVEIVDDAIVGFLDDEPV